MIELTTDRLLLRDPVPEDLLTHHGLLSDPKVMWYLPDIMTRTIEQSRANLQTAMEKLDEPDRRFYFFRMEERGTGELVGQIGYTVTEFTPLGKLAGVGYFIREKFWGMGYTAEALDEVLRFAFEENDVYRISCGCLAENRASERVMLKCGMVKEAEFKEYQWHDGKLKDRVEYRLLRSEWG